ncbi:hypothetical protein A6C57_06970 [Fibrella sp. ES10-3-2-2]|nr:hypothetical protein A6C57_06970 [Fibrella sp. ES10-3-2-2]
MKHILLFLFLCPSLVYPQIPKIEGIGPLKIGKTSVAVIGDLANERAATVEVITDIPLMPNVRGIYQVMASASGEPSAHATQCPQTKVYLIGRYEVAGIRLEKMFLTFYGGVLISITCDGNDELSDALKTKYGPPKVTVSSKEITCRYVYGGNEVKNREETISSRWINGDLVATETQTKFYDSSCRPIFLHSLNIGAQSKVAQAAVCDREWRAKIEAIKKSAAKDKLKDF